PVELVVLGAAADAELADLASWQVVATALGRDVRILFVGPEVPDELAGSGAQQGRVAMRFVQSTYDALLLAGNGPAGGAPAAGGGAAAGLAARAPDAFLAFNPGFTCPDYEWDATLAALGRAASSRGGAPPPRLIVATNTQMEGLMEAEMLGECGWQPATQLARNPYTSLKAIQSGTLANDLYRKNAWLVVYQHVGKKERRWVREKQRKGGKGQAGGRRKKGGKGPGKGSAKRVARALYDAVVGPLSKLVRRR
ncbi:hypothetical protein Agub_g1748, partial [Astrephomene gubernaculifera]